MKRRSPNRKIRTIYARGGCEQCAGVRRSSPVTPSMTSSYSRMAMRAGDSAGHRRAGDWRITAVSCAPIAGMCAERRADDRQRDDRRAVVRTSLSSGIARPAIRPSTTSTNGTFIMPSATNRRRSRGRCRERGQARRSCSTYQFPSLSFRPAIFRRRVRNGNRLTPIAPAAASIIRIAARRSTCG